MAEIEIRVFFQEDSLVIDRKLSPRLGDELFVICMTAPLVKKAVRMGMMPSYISTYHLTRSASPRGAFINIVMQGELSDDDLVLLLMTSGDIAIAGQQTVLIPLGVEKYIEWCEAEILLIPSTALPIF